MADSQRSRVLGDLQGEQYVRLCYRLLGKIRVTPTGCFEWQARRNEFGYGSVGFKKKRLKAHRVSWEVFRGPIPEGMCVCHHCDNPCCINPDHLFIGTRTDNMRDASRKGRIATGDRHSSRTHPESVVRGDQHPSRKRPECLARGDRHPSKTKPECVPRGEHLPWTKLTEDRVREIRLRRANGESLQALAKEFGVVMQTIHKIVKRKTWTHI